MKFYNKEITQLVWDKNRHNSNNSRQAYIPNFFEKLQESTLLEIIFSKESSPTKYSPIKLIESRNNKFIINKINEEQIYKDIEENKKRGYTTILRTPILFQHQFQGTLDNYGGHTIFQDLEDKTSYILNRTKNKNNRTFVQGGLNKSKTHYEARKKENYSLFDFEYEDEIIKNTTQEYPTYDFNRSSSDLISILREDKFEFE